MQPMQLCWKLLQRLKLWHVELRHVDLSIILAETAFSGKQDCGSQPDAVVIDVMR